jgi:hypothetical protein
MLEKLDICMQKTETRSMFVTLYKYQLKVDLNIRPETLKLIQERAGNTLEAISIGNDLLNRIQIAQGLTERIPNGVPFAVMWNYKASAQQKKLFPNWDAAHRMGENVCQLYIRKRFANQNIQGVHKTKLPKIQ